jgi:hypothetical protein
LGAAGEPLVATYYLAMGHPVYFPVAQAGWTDLAVQTPHGFQRVQVKTTSKGTRSIRVRGLGSTNDVEPADRYDILAVVHKHRLWLIPSTVLDGRDDITIHPKNHNCRYAPYRKR